MFCLLSCQWRHHKLYQVLVSVATHVVFYRYKTSPLSKRPAKFLVLPNWSVSGHRLPSVETLRIGEGCAEIPPQPEGAYFRGDLDVGRASHYRSPPLKAMVDLPFHPKRSLIYGCDPFGIGSQLKCVVAATPFDQFEKCVCQLCPSSGSLARRIVAL